MQKQPQVVSLRTASLLIMMVFGILTGCSGGGGGSSNSPGGETNFQGGVHGPLNGRIVYEAFGKGYLLDLASGHTTKLPHEIDDDPKGSPDGAEIVSVNDGDSARIESIVISKADGRKVSSFPVSGGTSLPKLSPDKQTIIAEAGDSVALFSREGKILKRLPGVTGYNWTPNGHLVYASEGVIYRDNTDLSQQEQIQGGFDSYPQHLSVSPDGSQIVFSLLQPNPLDSERDIWIMKMDGTGLRQLTDSSERHGEFHTAWSPDGRWVLVRQKYLNDAPWGEYDTFSDGKLFAVPADANKVDLTLINPDQDYPGIPFDPPDSPAIIIRAYGEKGDSLPTVTAGRSSLSWLEPLPSSPGSLPTNTNEPNRGLSGSVYYSFKPLLDESYEGWALDLASGVRSRLPGSIPKSAIPSPDGSEFAYVDIQSSNDASIILVSRDGASETTIISIDHALAGPIRFSQDSSLLAFMADGTVAADEDMKKPGVFVSTRDGAPVKSFPGFTSYDWLPNGDLILAGSNDEVYRGDVQSGITTRLFSMGSGDNIYQLAASPDGKRVAFGIANRIWVSDLNGENQQRLTQSPRAEAWPQWSPDGRYILFVYKKDARSSPSLWVVAADAQAVQVGNEVNQDAIPLKAIVEDGDLEVTGHDVDVEDFGRHFSWR